MDTSKARFAGINQDLHDSIWKSQFISSIMMPAMFFVGNFSYVLVIIVGAALALEGHIDRDYCSLYGYVRTFSQPLSQIAQGITSLRQAGAAVTRVLEFLAGRDAGWISWGKTIGPYERGSSLWSCVLWLYTRAHYYPWLFCDCSCWSKVAIVGPTGAGKTTIVQSFDEVL